MSLLWATHRVWSSFSFFSLIFSFPSSTTYLSPSPISHIARWASLLINTKDIIAFYTRCLSLTLLTHPSTLLNLPPGLVTIPGQFYKPPLLGEHRRSLLTCTRTQQIEHHKCRKLGCAELAPYHHICGRKWYRYYESLGLTCLVQSQGIGTSCRTGRRVEGAQGEMEAVEAMCVDKKD